MAYFLICLAGYSFGLIFFGWTIGNKDGKKEVEEKYGRKN